MSLIQFSKNRFWTMQYATLDISAKRFAEEDFWGKSVIAFFDLNVNEV